MNTIITIGRQFGSGGREFGRRLAEELGYQYYDREIIAEIAKATQLHEDYVSDILEQKPSQLMPITIGNSIYVNNYYMMEQIQAVYRAQSEIMKTLAEKSNCVIIGRCADYILRDYKPFRIFVYAEMESRINRCLSRKSEDEHFTNKELKKIIKKIDKNRSKYYDYYTGLTWGDKHNYDLCINTTNVNIKELVPVIAKIFK